MRKIDVSQWKEFKISHILTKVNTAKLKYRTRDLPKKPNSIYELPASTSSVINQGLSVYVPKDKATVLSNCLLVLANGDAGTVFYEPKSFTILQDSYALNLTNDYISHNSMNVYLYLASILTKLFHRHFGWNNKAVWTRAKNLMVKLPVDKNGDPDWHYMNEYIAKLATQAHTNISLLRQQQKKAPTVNIDRWKEFKLTELFNVKTGAYLSKNQLKPGSIPRVTVSSVNNGIVGSFERCGLSNERLFSNFLSVNFFGNVFYHDSLCSVDMKVHVLEPKHLYSKESMLFLVAVLRRKFVIEGYGTYGNQLSSSKLKMDMVYLPVDASGSPDWQYMDNYISSIQQAQKERVARLTSIVKKISIPVNGYFCY